MRLIRKLWRDYFRFRNFKQQTKRKCKRRKKGRKITLEDKTSENATVASEPLGERDSSASEWSRTEKEKHPSLSLFLRLFLSGSFSRALSLGLFLSLSLTLFKRLFLFSHFHLPWHLSLALSHSLTLSSQFIRLPFLSLMLQ